MPTTRWRGTPGGWRAPARNPFEGARFAPNPVPRTPGGVFPQAFDLGRGPSAASLGQALAPDPVTGVGPVLGPPAPGPLHGPASPTFAMGGATPESAVGRTRLFGPGSLGESTAAAGRARTVPMAGGAPYQGAASLGERMAAPAGWPSKFNVVPGVDPIARTLSRSLGNEMPWLSSAGKGGVLGKMGRVGKGLGAGIGWQLATGIGADAAGGDDTIAGQFLRGASPGGQAALIAGRNPVTAPVSMGAGIANVVANTGWGNDLINAPRKLLGWDELPEGYDLTDTMGNVWDKGTGFVKNLVGLEDDEAPAAAEVPMRDRLNAFAQQQDIDPAYMDDLNGQLDYVRAMYEQFPETLPAGEDGKALSIDDAMNIEYTNALGDVLSYRDQQEAQDQQFAQMAAMQSFVGEAMRPYAQQTDQAGQLMAAAWKNYAGGAPSWMQPYANFQSEQAAASGKRLSAAYAQQAQMMPAMMAMDSVQGRQAQIDQALWQMQMGGLTGGGGVPQSAEELLNSGG